MAIALSCGCVASGMAFGMVTAGPADAAIKATPRGGWHHDHHRQSAWLSGRGANFNRHHDRTLVINRFKLANVSRNTNSAQQDARTRTRSAAAAGGGGGGGGGGANPTSQQQQQQQAAPGLVAGGVPGGVAAGVTPGTATNAAGPAENAARPTENTAGPAGKAAGPATNATRPAEKAAAPTEEAAVPATPAVKHAKKSAAPAAVRHAKRAARPAAPEAEPPTNATTGAEPEKSDPGSSIPDTGLPADELAAGLAG